MNSIKIVCIFLLVTVQLSAQQKGFDISPLNPNTHSEKKEWFNNAKFGIFIHWNPSCVTQKVNKSLHPFADPNSPWKDSNKESELTAEQYKRTEQGTGISWGRIGPRPGKNDKSYIFEDRFTSTPYAQYNLFYKSFHPNSFDANKWATLFKTSGAKYVVLITKHHDGFAMFDAHQSLVINEFGYPETALNGNAVIAGKTDNNGWKITNPNSFGKDIVADLTEELRAAGLQIGFYYSNPDWTHPNYNPSYKKTDDNNGLGYRNYMESHVEQLLTEYGDILCLWFDGLSGSHPSHWGGDSTYSKLRAYQTSTLFNNRFYFSIPEGKTAPVAEDYYTPERKKGHFDITHKWESCDIICEKHTWSYLKDNPVKPFSQILTDIVDVIDNGGNYLLNITPDEFGNIPAEQIKILDNIGVWMDKYERTIFNTQAGPFLGNGTLSSSFRDNHVFLHIRTSKLGEQRIILPVIEGNKLKSVRTVLEANVPFKKNDEFVEIELPTNFQPNSVMETLILEYSKSINKQLLIELSAESQDLNTDAICASDFANACTKKNMQLVLNWKHKKKYGFKSIKSNNPNLTIELNNEQTVKEIQIKTAKSGAQKIDGLMLEYSTDKQTYQKLWQANSEFEYTNGIITIPCATELTGATVTGIKMKDIRITSVGTNQVLKLHSLLIH